MATNESKPDPDRMNFWDLLQTFRDETGASEAWIMRRAGLGKGTFAAWRARGIPRLPEHDQLIALSDVLRIDYGMLLDVILHDTLYLPEEAARAQAEYGAAFRDEFWRDVHRLAVKAVSATGGRRGRELTRFFTMGPGRDAPTMVSAKARAIVEGRMPTDAPAWLSDLFDTPDFKAVAQKGDIEEPGE